jgi:hypothetical protein
MYGWASVFKPLVRRTVDLYEFSETGPAIPGLVDTGLLSVTGFPFTTLDLPLSDQFSGNLDVKIFFSISLINVKLKS